MARSPSSTELVDALLTVTHGMKRSFNARLQDLDLSLARAKVLLHLDRDGAMRIGALSNDLDVAARTMTSTVEALERDGLVDSAPDPSDARARLISITPAGQEVLVDILKVREEASDELFGSLGATDRATLLGLLERLRAAVVAHELSGRGCPDEVS